MRIGLIADTHVPEAGSKLPDQVYQVFRGVDLILHAGDMHVIEVLDWLEGVAPVLGVRGNGDYRDNSNFNRPGIPEDHRVKDRQILEIEDLRVGVTHMFPLPEEVPWRTTKELLEIHFGGPVDVVICGDTHVARVDHYENLCIVNPGSPTLPNQMVGCLGTVGILEIVRNQSRATIVQMRP